MVTATRDSQRSRVYTSEEALCSLYDHPGTTEIFGVQLQLEPEARFASIESVQAYVDRVVAMPSVVARFGRTSPVSVRERKGGKFAHYDHRRAEIAINTEQTRWALRELVVLHELAHHYAGPTAKHGPSFTATLVALLDLVMGPQASLALVILQRESGAV